jgi:hypothetical protein
LEETVEVEDYIGGKSGEPRRSCRAADVVGASAYRADLALMTK